MKIQFWKKQLEPIPGIDIPAEEDENAVLQIHDEIEFNKINKTLDNKTVKAAERLIERLSDDDCHEILKEAYKKQSLMDELKFIDKREGK